jgi:Flp pilus assembly pilin Flp
MIRFLRRLRGEDRGTAVIELAILAPMITVLTIGIIDVSNAFGTKLKAEQAAQRSIEKIMNTSATDTIENTLAAEAADQADVPLSNVTVTYLLQCDGTVTEGGECGEEQQTAQWISVTVTDTYEPIFTTYFGSSGDGLYHVSATAGVRIQ